MELILSTWRVTLAGAVLLDFGDLLEAEPETVPSRQVEVVTPLRAAFSVRIPRGNAAFTLTFTRCKQFATPVLVEVGGLVFQLRVPKFQTPWEITRPHRVTIQVFGEGVMSKIGKKY